MEAKRKLDPSTIKYFKSSDMIGGDRFKTIIAELTEKYKFEMFNHSIVPAMLVSSTAREDVGMFLGRVTPAIAARLIKEVSPENRNTPRNGKEYLMREMTEKRYMYNGIPLHFDLDGYLFNGNTRMSALSVLADVISTGEPLLFTFMYNCEAKMQNTLDTGAPRNYVTALEMAGYKVHAKELGNVIELYTLAQNGEMHRWKKRKFSPSEMVTIVNFNPELVDATNKAMVAWAKVTKEHKYVYLPKALFTRMYGFLSMYGSNSDVEFFMTTIATENNLSLNHPFQPITELLYTKVIPNGKMSQIKVDNSRRIKAMMWAWHTYINKLPSLTLNELYAKFGERLAYPSMLVHNRNKKVSTKRKAEE